MKVYTKTGDKGTTSLVGGRRVSKADSQVEVYGTSDELNAFVGLLRACELPQDVARVLHVVQCDLFRVGGFFSLDVLSDKVYEGLEVTDGMIEYVEGVIDAISDELPPMRSFVLPAGSEAVARAHVCRTVARRLERQIVALGLEGERALKVQIYVNRLSDLFFVMGRRLSQLVGDEVCMEF